MSRRRLLAAAAAILGAVTAGAMAAEPQPQASAAGATAVATFAGGCFWCMESDFEKVPGVGSVVSGYTGGTKANPTYHEVGYGGTGHAEAVEVHYDPGKVTYAHLLDVFWHNVDLVDAGGQFCDRGDQYRSEIFYHNDEEKRLAETSKAELENSHRFSKPIVTRIEAAGPFYEAEDYHQDYYKKNPVRYHYYRWNCGRDQRLTELWGSAKPAS